MTEKLQTFYAANPDEEMTFEDIMAKFSCTYETATKSVGYLRGKGLLESVHVVRVRAKGIAK